MRRGEPGTKNEESEPTMITRMTALICGCSALLLSAISDDPPAAQPAPPDAKAPAKAIGKSDDPYQAARERMVRRHLIERGIKDKRVLDAFRETPRHRLLDSKSWPLAYEDFAIPIGEGQTISSPFIVAFMTEALQPKPTDKIYEVGTGSGYQAAILSRLVKDVYSVEIHRPLGEKAAKLLKEIGCDNVHVRVGDGYEGWPDAAPFDAIIVTCSPMSVPPPLVEQLREGGRMVIPLGDRYNQSVYIMTKINGKLEGKAVHPTLFVPMTGKSQTEAAKTKTQSQPKPANEPAKGKERKAP